MTEARRNTTAGAARTGIPIDEAEVLGARILVVDDQPANVELTHDMLAQAGYTRVSWTADPREACALHRENRYDLILLDLQTPETDGFTVMEGLRADTGDVWLPVLVITAQPSHKLRALQAGARDFIGKPVDLIELRTRIRNMLEARLLYQRLEAYGEALEATVAERTAQLRESEARYRGLTELASDWYWEQDEAGNFTKVSGPVLEMLGVGADGLVAGPAGESLAGWNETERAALRAAITAREPFLDFVFSRTNADGKSQRFQVSGEPMFGAACQYLGYRGIGVELRSRS